jgi:shikimate dehydrogenase
MQVFGLVGNPVGHSLSPPMHEAAYDSLGMDARYVTFEPAPETFQTAIAGAEALGINGLNVTIPFKQDAIELVDPDPLAERIGAVNTIDFTGETPRGYNTDAAGVRRAFARHDVSFDGRRAVVVGAGGAGRAAAFALADDGARVHIANRTTSRADELAAAVNESGVDDSSGEPATSGDLDSLASAVPDADILVNATSVGMESEETPVPANLLHADLAVLDAVYTPLETRLLCDAREAGATTIDGAWMLLYQGVVALERWTGRDAPVAEMDAALRSRL